jgi:hypothetical protein
VAVVRNVVEDVVLAGVRVVSLFVVVAYFLFLFMLLMAISDENVRSCLLKCVLKLSWILNNNHLLINAIEASSTSFLLCKKLT